MLVSSLFLGLCWITEGGSLRSLFFAQISSQADWLVNHGINELVDEGRYYWEAHASMPDLEAMLMRSRVRESEALCAPDGLGNFTVIEWSTP